MQNEVRFLTSKGQEGKFIRSGRLVTEMVNESDFPDLYADLVTAGVGGQMVIGLGADTVLGQEQDKTWYLGASGELEGYKAVTTTVIASSELNANWRKEIGKTYKGEVFDGYDHEEGNGWICIAFNRGDIEKIESLEEFVPEKVAIVN